MSLVKISNYLRQISSMRILLEITQYLPLSWLIRSILKRIVSGWNMKRLSMQFEDTFVRVRKEIRYSVGSMPMVIAAAITMWQDANVGPKVQRFAFRCHNVVLKKMPHIPSEYGASKKAKISARPSVHNALKPISTGDEYDVLCFLKPTVSCLNYSLARQLCSSNTKLKTCKNPI